MKEMNRRLDVFINPNANRGAARGNWPRVEAALCQDWQNVHPWFAESAEDLHQKVADAIGQGASCLAAAGGDGTLQTVLDALMETREMGLPADELCLGAIGMGTSNDFHKPAAQSSQLAGFPCRLQPDQARLRDVIRLDATLPSGITRTHYFLQSSHAGAIPAANDRLTRQKSLASRLYPYWYSGALMLASAQEVFTFPGFSATIEAGSNHWEGLFSGMSIIKHKHVAGSFVFRTPRTPDDGLFDLAICNKVGAFRLISLINAFEKQGLRGHPEVHCIETNEVRAKFGSPLPIDFDGELIDVTAAHWKIVPRVVKMMG